MGVHLSTTNRLLYRCGDTSDLGKGSHLPSQTTCQFKGQLQTTTAPTAKPDLRDSSTLFCAHPVMPENVMAVGDTRWIGGLTKVAIYPAPKGCGPCHSATRSEGYKVANYLVNLQTT